MDFLESKTELDEQTQKLSVSDATRMIKTLLESTLPALWIEGELSNFKHHSSGHMYFVLKDEKAQLACVMWASRNRSLYFKPIDGMSVLVYGRVTVYERRGQYQLDVQQMLPAGVGTLQLAFDQLKMRLSEEGLFDQQHKRRLPRFPLRIGIVTSPTGAAIRDLVSVLTRRWPVAEIILRPALVQGPEAAADIAAGIADLNAFGDLDVLIVGRGGGSIEDLWAFNEEIVARAIFDSRIPVVSAVGHEIDYTIADFVADLRAPTPSAAAELVVPDAREIRAQVVQKIGRAYTLLQGKLKNARAQLESVCRSYGFRRPGDFIAQSSQRLDELTHRLKLAARQQINNERFRLVSLEKQLRNLSYRNVLQRGFTITRNAADGQIIKSKTGIQPQQELQIVFHDGVVDRIYQLDEAHKPEGMPSESITELK